MKYVAFLRAINVGGHIVKMDRLRRLFEELGLSNVETVIASGNVMFETRRTARLALETAIERHLHDDLGYDVATFLRTPEEIAAIATFAEPADSETLYVGMAKTAVSAEGRRKLAALKTPTDEFTAIGSEVYWRLGTGFSDSIYSGATVEKALGMPVTFRNMTTIRKLVARL